MSGKELKIAGKKFNNLLALNPSFKKHGTWYWSFLCDCGNIKTIRATRVKKGEIINCGCKRKKPVFTKSRKKIKSKYEEYGGVGFGYLYIQYQQNAKKRGYEFKLTPSQFYKITSDNCHYCGIEPRQEKPLKRKGEILGNYIYNGIDRKDNNIGYIYYNALPCCGACNKAKGNMSYEDFKEYIKRLVLNNK